MSEAAGATPLQAMFGLTSDEADRLVETCTELLDSQGVDGRAFGERLRGGASIGRALGLPADLEGLLYERAHRWFTVSRPDRAEPLFRALCVLAPDDADSWVGLGVCLRLRDDLGGAALAFATASRLKPRWAVPAFHACELALRAGRLGDAAAEFSRFEALADRDTPETLVGEAARLRHALDVRGAAPGRAAR